MTKIMANYYWDDIMLDEIFLILNHTHTKTYICTIHMKVRTAAECTLSGSLLTRCYSIMFSLHFCKSQSFHLFLLLFCELN